MKRTAGFTLLELTIAIMLVTLIAAAIVSAFGTGLRVWDKVQQKADLSREKDAILEVISADLRNAWLNTSGTAGSFILQENVSGGDKNALLSFSTLLPDRVDGRIATLSQITYRLDSDGTLSRRVGPAVSHEKLAQEGEQVLETDTEEDVVAAEVQNFAVRCWGGDGLDWQEAWPPTETASAQRSTGLGSSSNTKKDEAERRYPLPEIVEITIEKPLGDTGQTQVLRTQVTIEMGHP